MATQQLQRKQIKICLLGSQNVGKSYLVHKLVGRDYLEQMPTIERQKLVKQISEYQTLLYHDYPPMESKMMDELPNGEDLYEIMIFLFKDSVSFGQLYEFFEEISKKTDENVHQFNNYWENIKHMVLVYSDYLEQKQVQTDELFKILSQEIRNFNRCGNIHKFVLRKEQENHQYLKELIEQRILQKINEKAENNEEKIEEEEEQVRYEEKEQKETQLSSSKINLKESINIYFSIIKEEETNIQIQQQEREVVVQIIKEDHIEEIHHSQPHNEEIIKHQIKEIQPTNQLVEKQVKLAKQSFIQSREILIQTKQLAEQAKEVEQIKEISKNNQITRQSKRLEEGQEIKKKSQQNQHYQQVYNRIMQKINSQQLKIEKKASYQDLFEEFRRTSNQSGKASKELCQYWEQKVRKLEQEDGQESEQEQKQQQQEDVQLKTQRLHAASTDPTKHVHPHGDPLKPATTYLDGKKQKKQKKQIQTKPCLCEIM